MNLVKKFKMPLTQEAFVTSVGFDELNQVFGVCTTDGYIHFY